MLRSITQLVFRSAAILLSGLLPFAAPLDVRPPEPGHLARPLVVGAFVCALVALTAWSLRRSRLAAASTALSLLTAIVGAAYFSGSRGPLGRAIPIVAPIEWVAIASIGQALVRAAWAQGPGRAIGAGLGTALLTLMVGIDRFESREAMWASVLARDAGNESAALHTADLASREGRNKEALDVLSACTRANALACECAVRAAELRIDSGGAREALRTLEATRSCGSDRLDALRAEAMVQSGNLAAGLAVAERVLLRSPNDPHALYAVAFALAEAREWDAALAHTQKALDAGRGAPAGRLQATIYMNTGQYEAAAATLHRAIVTEPTSAAAHYDLGVIADHSNRYHDAREEYLEALRLDPRMSDARVNLFLLTHRNGASKEARHHLEKLAEADPAHPRLAELRSMVEGPSTH